VTPDAGARRAEQLWAAYLDAVEDSARAVERTAPEQAVPVVTPLPPPDAPWPAALEPRRREVLATLAAAQQAVLTHRNRTAAALRALHRPAGIRHSGYADGEHLDVVG
jgi:hypothetical protein